MNEGAYGNNLGSRFGLDDVPVVMTRALSKACIAVTEIRSDQPRIGKTESIPVQDAFLVGLQLRAYPSHQYWEDNRQAPTSDLNGGDIVLYDLKRDPIVYIDRPIHSIHFYITREVLDTIAERENAQRIGDLRYAPGAGTSDQVVRAGSERSAPGRSLSRTVPGTSLRGCEDDLAAGYRKGRLPS